MRTLKHHEEKLLKKVNFLHYKRDTNVRELQVMRRYHITDREDYTKYNRIVGQIKKLATKLKGLDPKDPFRIALTEQLLDKLFNLGFITTKKSLLKAEEVNVSAVCRRRLPVVMVRLKFAETVKLATEYVEQGHIKVGPHPVTDPSYLVSRSMEDYLTWANKSKIKRHVMKYNDKLDDFDLLEC